MGQIKFGGKVENSEINGVGVLRSILSQGPLAILFFPFVTPAGVQVFVCICMSDSSAAAPVISALRLP